MLRFLLRFAIQWGPRFIAVAVDRLPFSRFARLLPLLGGPARTSWRGAQFVVDPSDTAAFYRYFFPDGADPEFEFLHEACADASVFFDVGSNQGFYAVALAHARSRLKVVAFEPDESLSAALARNVALNPDVSGRVDVVTSAVAESSGDRRMRIADPLNSGIGRLMDEPTGTLVKVTSLMDFHAASGLAPEVIKIDVEGAELQVLEGLGQLAAGLRAAVVELHPAAFSSDERPAYQQKIVAALGALPLRWRYVVNEPPWMDTLPPEPWPERFHAFGTRD